MLKDSAKLRSPTKKSNLKFMFPFALERCRRHLLTVPAGCNVSGVLRCSRDGWVGENTSQPGLRSCEPPGFRRDEWVSTNHSVTARVVSLPAVGPGRSCTGGTRQILSTPCFQSFLHVGDEVVRRQDTSRARVQVIEPLVGDKSSIHVTCCQAPLERSVLFRRLSRLLRGADESLSLAVFTLKGRAGVFEG